MYKEPDPGVTVTTERTIKASQEAIFNAFQHPDELAQWWGPDGFTNTFNEFQFTPGGRWSFVMHGPNGVDYPNESVFRAIVPYSRIEIEHVVKPWYWLTVLLTARGDHTRLVWVQQFENVDIAEKMRSLSSAANEQVLNRLEAHLSGKPTTD